MPDIFSKIKRVDCVEMGEKYRFKTKDWSWVNSNDIVDSRPVTLPNGLYFLWSTIPLLKGRYNIATLTGRVGMVAWWLVNGIKEYPALDIIIKDDERLYELADIPKQVEAYPVSRIVLAAAELNDTLMSSIDIFKLEDRIKLINWYYRHVVQDSRNLSEIELKYFSDSAPDIIQDTLMPITRAMTLCWHARDDLQEIYDISTKGGRLGFEAWWFCRGYRETPPYMLTEGQCQKLSKVVPGLQQDGSMPITYEMILIWRYDEKLRNTYNLSTAEGRQDYIYWWESDGRKCLVSKNITTKTSDECYTCNASLALSTESKEAYIAGGYHTDGINLIGLVKGELGIGEDVRMAARVMRAAEVNYSIFNFPKRSFSRQQDMSLADHINDELVYDVNMVNLTGFEHASLFAKYGNTFFDKRFTIGAWPWELPKWPRFCDIEFNLVDEIWASSKYAVDAYSNSPVPVVHMPMAVDFDSIPEYTRSDFELPPDSYLFLYVFDSLSYMARKNPIAHLEAFWKAFPRSRVDVGLVVKTMNADIGDKTWSKFHEMVATDDRIILISETLSKDKILGLMNCCDAFLSLHRSEGFGRCIAEMMWMGKPVIATNFSGNTDFTTKETAFLVDGPLIVVGRGDYPYSENQYWCDPDVEQAAHHMRVCFEGGSVVNDIAEKGSKLIRQRYSFEAVAKKYTERLKRLGIM